MQPTSEAQRIETLDVLRGFALLGILLLDIVGFGMLSATYSNPGLGVATTADLWTWVSVELFAEGAMRALFSILFGAGVVLFTTGVAAKSAGVHYKRNIWLLAFGLIDAYLLLWSGDILINYALAGMLLYFVRNTSAKRLLITAGVLISLMSLMHLATAFGLGQAREAALQLEQSPSSVVAENSELVELADSWREFAADFQPSAEEQQAELAARRESYSSAFSWNAEYTNQMLLFVLPLYLFWDALALMLIGMGLYKLGVLQGDRSRAFYQRLMLGGFAIGLLVNGFEVWRAQQSDFALLSVFAQGQVTYHVGRLGMALGYLGLLVLLVKSDVWQMARKLLANVGRMALTNYLSHSLICLMLFTGAGFALVGHMSRLQLYGVVLSIWLFQLWFSTWWLARYRYGPLEWLWRGLTYGQWPTIRR